MDSFQGIGIGAEDSDMVKICQNNGLKSLPEAPWSFVDAVELARIKLVSANTHSSTAGLGYRQLRNHQLLV